MGTKRLKGDRLLDVLPCCHQNRALCSHVILRNLLTPKGLVFLNALFLLVLLNDEVAEKVSDAFRKHHCGCFGHFVSCSSLSPTTSSTFFFGGISANEGHEMLSIILKNKKEEVCFFNLEGKIIITKKKGNLAHQLWITYGSVTLSVYSND